MYVYASCEYSYFFFCVFLYCLEVFVEYAGELCRAVASERAYVLNVRLYGFVGYFAIVIDAEGNVYFCDGYCMASWVYAGYGFAFGVGYVFEVACVVVSVEDYVKSGNCLGCVSYFVFLVVCGFYSFVHSGVE